MNGSRKEQDPQYQYGQVAFEKSVKITSTWAPLLRQSQIKVMKCYRISINMID